MGQSLQGFARGIDRCVASGQEFVPVFIHSTGGSTWGLGAMLALIDACPVPIVTIAVGCALSAAADLLAAGRRGARFVAPHTTIMVHEAIESATPKKIHEVNASVAHGNVENELFLSLLDKHTGHRAGWWRSEIRKRGNSDWWMTAEKAVANGLADHVGIPTISTSASVNIGFEDKTPPKKAKRTARRSK